MGIFILGLWPIFPYPRGDTERSLINRMRPWKHILRGLILGLVCLLGTAFPAHAADPSVRLNGEVLDFPDTKPMIQDGRTLVPVRFVAEELGADVTWSKANAHVSIAFGDHHIIMDLPQNRVAVDGRLQGLDVKAVLVDGRTMVPLRFISEAMGLDVNWQEEAYEVDLRGQVSPASPPSRVILGNERLLQEYAYLVEGKRIGLVTNQTGVDGQGTPFADILYAHPTALFMAAYAPEHGIDGRAPAGAYVASYWDANHQVPVYSLYGATRKPSRDMVQGIDVFVFDMQDIGSRTYTYMSTLNYVLRAGAEYGIPVVVLDRPNPLGGDQVEGHMMQDRYQTFVGVDTLPIQHGMTAGELALYFNRKIGAHVEVVPMRAYDRSMIWQDTGLPFTQTSPNIPTLSAAFHYIATGMGTDGLGQADYFHWIGAKGISAETYAQKMNALGLPGVQFVAEWKGDRGGVRVDITDPWAYNPTHTAYSLILTADAIRPITPPVETASGIPMFEKIWGGTRFSHLLRQNYSPQDAIADYQWEVAQFRQTRAPYLLYD